MRVRDIMKGKAPREIITIRSGQTMLEAIRSLADHKVGALVVLDDAHQIVGILNEHDVVRECAAHHEALPTKRVSEVMSPDVIITLMDDDIDAVMEVMTEQHTRHLPVIDNGKLVGMISIGDVVKAQAHHSEHAVRHLTDYIMGRYPA